MTTPHQQLTTENRTATRDGHSTTAGENYQKIC